MRTPVIDLYCERLDAGLWAEPINLVTNAAFLVAGWLAWRSSLRQNLSSVEINLLIALVFTIGIGSTLFHSFATPFTNLLDVVPILLFQMLFLWIYCVRVIGLHPALVGALVLSYLAITIWARQFSHLMNGSLIYLPALTALLVLGWYHAAAGRYRSGAILFAAGIFVLSFTSRTIDQLLCPRWPIGTHFLWHLLNALLLYYLVRFLTEILGHDT